MYKLVRTMCHVFDEYNYTVLDSNNKECMINGYFRCENISDLVGGIVSTSSEGKLSIERVGSTIIEYKILTRFDGTNVKEELLEFLV